MNRAVRELFRAELVKARSSSICLLNKPNLNLTVFGSVRLVNLELCIYHENSISKLEYVLIL